MGGSVSKMMKKIFGSKQMRLLMLGLDAAGKTTILYKLKLDTDVTTIPTVGFNVEKVRYKNVEFDIWDVGGQDKIRPLWRHYYSGTQAIIFVVDSNDRDRMEDARKELKRVMDEGEVKEALLLVFANKQDLAGALSPQEVSERLELNKIKNRIWKVEPSCATSGEGIFEGLAWLSSYASYMMKKEKARMLRQWSAPTKPLEQEYLLRNEHPSIPETSSEEEVQRVVTTFGPDLPDRLS